SHVPSHPPSSLSSASTSLWPALPFPFPPLPPSVSHPPVAPPPPFLPCPLDQDSSPPPSSFASSSPAFFPPHHTSGILRLRLPFHSPPFPLPFLIIPPRHPFHSLRHLRNGRDPCVRDSHQRRCLETHLEEQWRPGQFKISNSKIHMLGGRGTVRGGFPSCPDSVFALLFLPPLFQYIVPFPRQIPPAFFSFSCLTRVGTICHAPLRSHVAPPQPSLAPYLPRPSFSPPRSSPSWARGGTSPSSRSPKLASASGFPPPPSS
ncbi:hypothetical protein Naga_100771g4, partial [Nannochloropsis gaditana]